MSKKLNIIEAMKMPIGTEFEVKPSIESCTAPNMYIHEGKGEAILKLKNGDFVLATESILSATFIPIQQPVSFMEAIEEGSEDKKVKVVMDRITFPKHFTDALNKYMTLNEIFKFMSEHLSRVGIRNVIKEGKWYIEESEDDSNERRKPKRNMPKGN